MTTLVEKMALARLAVRFPHLTTQEVARGNFRDFIDLKEEAAALAAALAHYSDPANVSDAMVGAAIAAWSDDYVRDAVHDDWERMIAAAMKAA